MANIVGTYYSNQNYNPKINYSVNYWQTARDANSVTYRFTVSYARQNGSYYYDVYINYSVGGKSGNVLLKANNDGTASTSCTFDVTCSTNAGGGTIYARIYSWSNTDSTHWQNGFDTGDKDVNKSTFNTAPYWGSGAVINLSPNGIVREDTSSVTVSWTGALDLETTSGMKYKVDRYINGNFSTTIANGTTLTSLVDNIGSGNSGNVYTYRVTPIDNYGVVGSTLTNSQSLTKNTLRGANITGNQSINNNTSSFSVNVSGGSNSMGTGNISRKLSSNNLTINNAYVGIGNITITIYKSGTVPTGAYILYEDIRALFKDATNQSGNFQITLSTYNEFGSSSQSTITANVDLRDVPNPPSNIKITGTKIVNGTSYYIPSIQNLTLTWNNGSDKVDGSTLNYEVQGSTSASSGWKTLASNIQSTSSTTSSTITISDGDFDGGRNYYFKVIGYNAFNLSSSAISSAIVLHKYSSPTVSFGIAKRTTTQLVVPITTTLNTSLPNITFNVSNSTEGLRKRNYSLKLKGTNTFVKPSTQITTSPQTITINGLEDSKEYVLEVIVNDTSGLTANDIAKQLDIGKYIPIVSIRDKGLGINDFADDNYKLAVGGNAKINGELDVKNGKLNTKEINNKGYAASYTGGSDYNKWTKIATITITSQYQEVTSIIDVLDTGSGSNIPVKGELTLRVKQQDSMSNSPVCSLYLSNYIVTYPDNYKLVITKNTTEKKEIDLWFRNIQSWSNVYFSPRKTNGDTNIITFQEQQPFTTSLPSGTQIPCYKIVTSSPEDIGAMKDGGTYGTIKLTNWIRTVGNNGWYSETYGGGWYMSDTTWIRAYNSKSVYTPGQMRAEGGFRLNNDNTKITTGQNNSLRVTTPSGFVDIGANNSSYCHFYTDREQFYFDKRIHLNGALHFYESPNANTRIATKSTGDIMLYTTARSRFEGSTDGRLYWYKGSTGTWYLIAGSTYGD